MSKKTPWFPADVAPARVGFYEISGTKFGGNDYRRWDGKQWSSTLTYAALNIGAGVRPLYAPGEDMTGWRGLTKSKATPEAKP